MKPNNLLSDKYVAISNIAGYYDKILSLVHLKTTGLLKPNNRLTGTFSWINTYRWKMFRIKCSIRGLYGSFS